MFKREGKAGTHHNLPHSNKQFPPHGRLKTFLSPRLNNRHRAMNTRTPALHITPTTRNLLKTVNSRIVASVVSVITVLGSFSAQFICFSALM
jgi:hypothetical protein